MLFVIDVTRTCGRRKETVSKSKRSVFGLLRHQSVGLVDLQSSTIVYIQCNGAGNEKELLSGANKDRFHNHIGYFCQYKKYVYKAVCICTVT